MLVNKHQYYQSKLEGKNKDQILPSLFILHTGLKENSLKTDQTDTTVVELNLR